MQYCIRNRNGFDDSGEVDFSDDINFGFKVDNNRLKVVIADNGEEIDWEGSFEVVFFPGILRDEKEYDDNNFLEEKFWENKEKDFFGGEGWSKLTERDDLTLEAAT